MLTQACGIFTQVKLQISEILLHSMFALSRVSSASLVQAPSPTGLGAAGSTTQ